ncbi:hypothetical protein Acy02nite_17280 [Actinoplanes cyaneus]|uniref:STAS domain-containing protein n=1 Tax=Actinoplanes cyaneus TaxID=52696 RepID=A0A919M2U9_9ACTN|nr:STAS domain-containing protein [Actinoplanes cyaneus]MCW2141996.1 anti-anti-sigma factor [Actinoplanes cyaneus]GID63847.1 hypothetical protein Acy02nite_17280 [Actinoplanes cyaneus]
MSTAFGSDHDQRLTLTGIRLPGGALRVVVTGELDIGTAAAFQERLSEILDGCPDQHVELDLAALDFCDLSGLRALHAVGRVAAEQRRPVRITVAGSCLDVLLNLCRTSAVLGYSPP